MITQLEYIEIEMISGGIEKNVTKSALNSKNEDMVAGGCECYCYHGNEELCPTCATPCSLEEGYEPSPGDCYNMCYSIFGTLLCSWKCI